MSTDPVRTTCPYCGVGCGVLATPDGTIAGDPAHPANLGRLCSKGSALGETLGLEGRLLHPEIHGERASWDEALDLVAQRISDTISAHGPDSVALYVSGQLLTEDYYAANKFAKGFLGTANIDSNSRLCMASAVAGHKRAFGEDIVPAAYADFELADLVILTGSNTAWCHPVLYQRILAARAARPGMKLVVIDPRRTATCEGADLHVALRPGSDVALFNFLLARLAPDSTDPAVEIARAESADAAALCGVAQDTLETLAAWIAATPRVVTGFSMGVNQSSAGTDKVNAILNLHIATGRIGRPGSGPFSLTGQPNAMGGREVGALANTLAGHLEWDRPGDIERVRRFWKAPNLALKPGRRAVDLFDAIARHDIRLVWIIATNPAVSLPDSTRVREALAGCETVIISEAMAEQDSADLAHIRLPALAWGEKDGTVTNSERVISRQRPFLPAPGEARPDWWAIAQVATRLGHADAFAWTGPSDIFREHARLSAHENDGARLFNLAPLADLSCAEYDALPPTRWGATRYTINDLNARLVPTPHREPLEPLSPDFPLVLNTGRIRDQWHSMTRTGKSPRLHAHLPEPFLALHPRDAGDIADGALVRLTTATGQAVLRARHDPGQRPGSVFAPMHWTDRFSPAGRVNPAVSPGVDPLSAQPELKHTPAQIAPYAAAWHGFMLTERPMGTDLAPWCAQFPTGQAWRHELAGQEPPSAAYARLRARIAAAGAWLELHDPGRSVHRGALVQDGVLRAALFVGPDHELPPRDWLAALIGAAPMTMESRRALLAGIPASGPAPEAPVCVCFGIGGGQIRAAIKDGATDLAAIGAMTRAGTNCGSCRPEIRAILTERQAAA
jgi:assimilatory nitrate reductase catalytic subunit